MYFGISNITVLPECTWVLQRIYCNHFVRLVICYPHDKTWFESLQERYPGTHYTHTFNYLNQDQITLTAYVIDITRRYLNIYSGIF
jgi:hypothetical protein